MCLILEHTSLAQYGMSHLAKGMVVPVIGSLVVAFSLLCRDGDIEYLKQRYEAWIDLDEWRMHTDLGNGFKLYVKNDQIGDKY